MQSNDIISDMIGTIGAVLGAPLPQEQQKLIEARMRRHWGGQEVYVKKSEVDISARDRRDLDIRARYNGKNRIALMTEYAISRSTFYKIINGA